jgi:ribonuclease HII
VIDLEYIRRNCGQKINSKGPVYDGPLFFLGCDEVGRGPLAGPVSSSAVCVTPLKNQDSAEYFEYLVSALEELQRLGVTDSKKLTAKKRDLILQNLSIEIKPKISLEKEIIVDSWDFSWKKLNWSISVCSLSHILIDQVNILNAAMKSMDIAIEKVTTQKIGNGLGWVDGNRLPRKSTQHLELIAQVKGDANVLLVGLASIIAKQWRDVWMIRMDEIFPEYGLAKHAGYPTSQHLAAIREYGPCPIHRMTFNGAKGQPYIKYKAICTKEGKTGNNMFPNF